jgi:hypothetical protein
LVVQRAQQLVMRGQSRLDHRDYTASDALVVEVRPGDSENVVGER